MLPFLVPHRKINSTWITRLERNNSLWFMQTLFTYNNKITSNKENANKFDFKIFKMLWFRGDHWEIEKTIIPSNYISYKNSCLKHKEVSLYIVGKTIYNANIPYGYWFMSWLIHFKSTSLLTVWKNQRKMAPMFEPLTSIWDTQMKFLAPGFVLIQPWLLWPSEDWISRKFLSPIFFYNSNTYVHTYIQLCI